MKTLRDGIAVIGVGDGPNEFRQHYFDSRAVERVYSVSLTDGELRLWRNAEPDSDDFSQRFIEALKEGGTFMMDAGSSVMTGSSISLLPTDEKRHDLSGASPDRLVCED